MQLFYARICGYIFALFIFIHYLMCLTFIHILSTSLSFSSLKFILSFILKVTARIPLLTENLEAKLFTKFVVQRSGKGFSLKLKK
jgi:hypothetical protein